MHDFLKDFEKRMEKLSYPFLIDNKVIMKREWEKYGLSLQQTLNLVYTVMCLIMDRSLKDEECIYKDINEFLMELLSQHFNIDLDEEQVYGLSKYIVMRVLRNEGVMFIFEAYDYEKQSKKLYQYHLVSQDYSKSDLSKSTFKLTAEGYRLMLNSFEVDQKLKIEIESFIAEESIKRNNYKQGLISVKNLDSLIITQIQSIDRFILRARENVLYIDQEEFNKSYKKDLEILKEQNKKFQDIKYTIVNEKNKVAKLLESNLDKEHMEALKQLAEIEFGLQKIIGRATTLIGKHIDLSDEYIKALDGLSYYYSNNKLDIKEKLLFPIEEDITRIDNIETILKCLFTPKINKRFNPDKVFDEQKVNVKEELEESVHIENVKHDDTEEIENKLIADRYIDIIRCILTFINKEKDTDLKNLIKEYEKRKYEDYIKLVPSVRQFSEVMIELIRIGEIDIQEFLEEYHQSYTSEYSTTFDLKSVLYEVINNDINLKKIKFIRILKKDNTDSIEIREKVSKEEQKIIDEITIAKCNNYILQME